MVFKIVHRFLFSASQECIVMRERSSKLILLVNESRLCNEQVGRLFRSASTNGSHKKFNNHHQRYTASIQIN